MTTGALIFAFNNDDIDYVAMATWSAKNIHRHLGIPVCLVTDQDTSTSVFDHVVRLDRGQAGSRYFEDLDRSVKWYNHNRFDAYAVTPWDQTLVLDADYVVASSSLKSLFHSQPDFLCHRYSYDLTRPGFHDGLNTFGDRKMPMWWATVMLFKKSPRAKHIFQVMRMVHDNWQHYCDLFGIHRSTYRNDFALSIAIGVVSGHTWTQETIPWNLAAVMPAHRLEQIDQDSYMITFEDANKRQKRVPIQGHDFHAMGKNDLGDIVGRH